ncbi:MAG: hypothetical protein HRT44_09515 [Bdellovibrionales bacterium]|nr:DUF4214 domain-containing protein [Bdellovibrionales bacterium]NQZ19477.1 hypothetical protein [Bdellovibrionales bacterium]
MKTLVYLFIFSIFTSMAFQNCGGFLSKKSFSNVQPEALQGFSLNQGDIGSEAVDDLAQINNDINLNGGNNHNLNDGDAVDVDISMIPGDQTIESRTVNFTYNYPNSERVTETPRDCISDGMPRWEAVIANTEEISNCEERARALVVNINHREMISENGQMVPTGQTRVIPSMVPIRCDLTNCGDVQNGETQLVESSDHRINITACPNGQSGTIVNSHRVTNVLVCNAGRMMVAAELVGEVIGSVNRCENIDPDAITVMTPDMATPDVDETTEDEEPVCTADPYICRAYREVLNRLPDKSGALFWTGKFNDYREDHSAEEAYQMIKNHIMASYEARGVDWPEEKVASNEIYNRYIVDHLGVGSNVHTTCVTGVDDCANPGHSTQEVLQRITEQIVEDSYQTVLNRPSDEEGKEFWTGVAQNLLDSGNDFHNVENAIQNHHMNSDEFQLNSIIEQVYQSVLGRASDAGGKAYWLGQSLSLRNMGKSYDEIRAHLRMQFMNSEEYRQNNS